MNIDSRMTLEHNVFAQDISLIWDGQYIGKLKYNPFKRVWYTSFSVPNVTAYSKFWRSKDGPTLVHRISRYLQMNVPE